ncbi:hypothetical protein [Actinomadura sp. B10D3]|uniref:hypothetical protein n=1 Tax=Actinomadura sp. B10D3 TaxID=3153557 RepID=UPI00325DAB30
MGNRWFRTIAAIGMVAAVLAAGRPPAAERRLGAILVHEAFTGATADARFVGYGAACLTGAPRGGLVAEGTNHPLGGCHPDPAGPVPPVGAAPHGYLQLTDAHLEETGAVLFDSPVPTRDGLEVTFEQWQYGNTTPTPADGISFFLTDGAGQLTTPGAFGGSLGYAQKLPDDSPDAYFVPGVTGGYLGLGLDVLGDYYGDGEKRGNGCRRRSPAGTSLQPPPPGPNIVTARGPGNGVNGYCVLAATAGEKTSLGTWRSTLPGRLHGGPMTMPANVTPTRAETLLNPLKRTVRLTLARQPAPMVTIDIDFQDGNGYRLILPFPAPEPIPATIKLRLRSLHRPQTDIHLIRQLTIRS